MNEHQQRALWGAALRSLADFIANGTAPLPTSMELWTQYVDSVRLMEIAEFSGPRALPISMHGTFASVRVPTGEPIDLPIAWIFQAQNSENLERLASDTKLFEQHNEQCVEEIGRRIDAAAAEGRAAKSARADG